MPLTLLVGRDEELAHETLLASQECRLLALIGPGGMGKTRLAIAAATANAAGSEHGTAFVALESVGAPTLVVSA